MGIGLQHHPTLWVLFIIWSFKKVPEPPPNDKTIFRKPVVSRKKSIVVVGAAASTPAASMIIFIKKWKWKSVRYWGILKSFLFSNQTKKKLYAQFKECGITAWKAISILKKAPRKGLKRLGEPATTLATRKFMNQLHSRTKGQRCRSSRSNNKKIPLTALYKIFSSRNKAIVKEK